MLFYDAISVDVVKSKRQIKLFFRSTGLSYADRLQLIKKTLLIIFIHKQAADKLNKANKKCIKYKLNKYVSCDWPLSIRLCLSYVRTLADSPVDFGLLGSQVHKNERFFTLDADKPPCKIWRR